MLKSIFLVGSGSFIGGISRYLLSKFIQNSIFSSFPTGTLLVNIVGCFIVGVISGLANRGNLINGEWTLFLTAGFCGGFTTFSTFANENAFMLKNGEYFYLALYTGLSIFLGVIAIFVGNLVLKIN